MRDQVKQAPLIDIKSVSRLFPKASGEDLVVLEKVDLSIRAGEIVGLLGRSGSGKSTLLRIIAGLVSPSSGEAKCRGETIEGPEVTLVMAKAEGWLDRDGSKWRTMPDLMLRYRAAAFFGRLYAPEMLLGMQTAEEAGDIIDVTPTRAATGVTAAKEMLQASKPTAEPATTDSPK